MAELPLVTVIIPTLNQGKYIAETLDSILRQDYPHFEILVMDGGSTDNTLDVLRRYEHDPRLVWHSNPYRGTFHALNVAHAHARGEIIGWQNSDDTYVGQVISPTVAYFQAHPEIGLIHGDVMMTDEHNQATGTILFGKPFDTVEQLSGIVPVVPMGVFWRKWVWEKAGGFSETYAHGLDIDFFVRASRVAKFAPLPGIRSTYRLHPDSQTVTLDFDMIRVREETAAKMLTQPDLYPELQGKRRLLDSNFAYLYAETHLRHGNRMMARRYARRALWKSPLLRRRWPYLLLFCVDIHLHTPFSRQLAHVWRWLKKRAGLR